MVGPMNVAGHDTGDDDAGVSEPRVSRKELKTAVELAGMIERDLAQHPDCPKDGFRVTVYGATHWRAMLTITEAGRVKTIAKVEHGILGVSNSFTRFSGTARECVGACFYASATKTRVWVCRDSDCNLDCSGREPVAGC